MDSLIAVLVVLGWPAFMVAAVWFRGDLGLPRPVEEWLEERRWQSEERERLAAERGPADPEYTTGAIVLEDAWAADSDLYLTGGRWWRLGRGDAPTMLVAEQSDFVFGPHWCIYEVDELEPRVIAAVPKEVVPTVHELVGHDIQPRYTWEPRRGAVDYSWKPVPAYVERSLRSTAAWAGRQRSRACA